MKTFSQFVDEATQTKIDLMKSRYRHNDEMMKQIVKADPTGKDYVQWLSKHVAKGNIKLPEDHSKIHGQLKIFDRLKKSPKFTGAKDIERYNPGELYKVIQSRANEKSGKEKSSDYGRLIVDKGDYKIYKIDPSKMGKSEATNALINASSGTNWCTAHQDTAEHYLEKGPSFVMVYKDHRFAQLHPKTGQFMDRTDESLIGEFEVGARSEHEIEDKTAIQFLRLGSHADPLIRGYILGININQKNPWIRYTPYMAKYHRPKEFYKDGKEIFGSFSVSNRQMAKDFGWKYSFQSDYDSVFDNPEFPGHEIYINREDDSWVHFGPPGGKPKKEVTKHGDTIYYHQDDEELAKFKGFYDEKAKQQELHKHLVKFHGHDPYKEIDKQLA